MESLPLWIGTVACAAAAAGGLLPLPRRRRVTLVGAALLLAPVLITADNWNSDRFAELRDAPALVATAAAVATAALSLLTRFFLRHPRWLPLAVIAVLPFRIPIDLGASSANLLLPLYAVLAAGLLAAWLRPGEVLPRPLPTEGPARLLGPLLAAAVVLYALQAAYADELSTAVENVCFFFAPFTAVFLLLAAAPWDRRLVRAAVAVIAIEALVVSVVGFGQSLTGQLLWNEKLIDGNEAHAYFRVNSLFYDPNIMGRYLAVTMVVLAAVAAWVRGRAQLAAAGLFVVLLAALVLTFSQTSMLALAAGMIVLAAAAWGLVRGAIVGLLAVATLALAVLGLGGGGLTAETTGRTGLVSGGLELAGDRPLTGFGSGSFAPRFEARFGGGDGIAVESHAEPVTVAAEGGAIGLLAYLALVAGSVVVLWSAAGLGPRGAGNLLGATLLATYAAMLVHSLGYAAFLTDPITWSLLALALALPAPSPSAVRPPPERPERVPRVPEAGAI